MFQKSDGEYYMTCSDCRKYNAAVLTKYKNKKKIDDKINKEIIEKDYESEFSYCTYSGHSTVVKSSHLQNLVPISLFRMEQDNPKSELYMNCLDCREYMRVLNHKFVDNVKSLADDKGLHACSRCNKLINHSDRPFNLDGTLSTSCISCKENSLDTYTKRKQHYIDIKFEFVENHQCSCYDCKFLF